MSNIQPIVDKINALKKQMNAVILAHNYQIPEVQDAADFGALTPALEAWARRVDGVEVHAYFHEFPSRPGLARIAVHARWKDPVRGKTRDHVSLRFLSDPFHRRSR